MAVQSVNNTQYDIAAYVGEKKATLSEEELFAAVVAQRLAQKFGAKMAESFQESLRTTLGKPMKNGRKVGYEDATYSALGSLVTKRSISIAQKNEIIAECFEAAQLDDKKEALWDDISGKNDPTKAVADFDTAINSATKALKEFSLGTRKPAPAPAPSLGKVGSGADGFLFKPVSNSSGTASVLFSSVIGRQTRSVTLQTKDGKVLDTGRFTSYGDDGSRAKYEFPKAGSRYPKDLFVAIQLTDGTTKIISVADPSKRTV